MISNLTNLNLKAKIVKTTKLLCKFNKKCLSLLESPKYVLYILRSFFRLFSNDTDRVIIMFYTNIWS